MNRIKLLAKWGFRKTKKSKFILEGWNNKILHFLSLIVPALLLICFGIVVYEFGFMPFRSNNNKITFWLKLLLNIVSILLAIRIVLEIFITKKKWVRVFNISGWLFIIFLTLYVIPEKSSLQNTSANYFLFYKLILYAGVVLAFITEISNFLQFIYSKVINPGLLFVGSFAFLILLGGFLLKLPNATYNGISGIDALFTSTSAVCVTGLIVVDTSTHFTPFGHLIILLLIQTGGLGIMTFAGLLAYAVAGHTSFKTQLAFKDMMSSRQVNNIMHFVYQVIFVTILFEVAGAAFIFFSLDDSLFSRHLDKIFFSIFHAVSAFCNAGFSTYTNGLYEPVVRFNYMFHLLIAALIILGGMGFPIVFNLYRYLRIKTSNLMCRIKGGGQIQHFPGLIFLNARLALVVSAILLIIGFIAYLLFEQTATLKQHPTLTGKIITSFFGSVTPRTAGFNTVDLTAMNLSTIMIYLLLMWIGASPGSTGGGIKTTTAGVAILNMVAILRGKDRTEFFRSEISHNSIRRAFAIIILSLLLIGISIFFVSIYDSDKGLIAIAFEVFSAFSTVGLSLGITANLSVFSKIVLMITMFVGRIGMITLLVAFIKQSKQLYYRYSKEDIAF
ncbi:MAG: ATPase [Chitinophagaceae bacterium]|nr:ATPase [Chitinophagaceae bacterium]